MAENKKNEKEKVKGPEIKDKVEVIFDPDDAEYTTGVEEDINEALSVAQRLKKKQQIRRYKAKMQIARKRSLKRRATNARLKSRARRTAVSNVKKKLSSGRNINKLSYAERARVEKLAARRKGMIQRQARRLIIKKRSLERKRLSRRS